MRHVPVLLGEVLELLQLKPGMIIVDGTLGDGGHAEAILERVGPTGHLIGMDRDPEALLRAKQYLYRFGNQVTYVRDTFERIDTAVHNEGYDAVHGILLDLGWSTQQFEGRGRGFSFLCDEPLDMRYEGELGGDSAADILNTWSEQALEKIFRDYADETLAREITEAIVAKRKEQSIERTTTLTEIILDTYRKKLKSKKEIPWVGGLHPATKVFQALRIAVNDEIGTLERALPRALDILRPGGRLAVISFHSGEDRITKHFFKEFAQGTAQLVTKKPVTCGEIEYEKNPRARSAKLRVIEKI